MGEIIRAVRMVSPYLCQADPSWCIYGSCALALNGLPDVEVHDVDILLTESGVRRMLALLPQVRLYDRDAPGGRFRSLHAWVDVEGVEIDLSGDLEVLHESSWTPVRVDRVLQSDGIRYASLQDCVRLLRLFGRPKDLQRLDALLIP
ncbi:MAG: hypothetical protein ACI4UA_05415 [Bacteroidaceae bacterium]